MRVLFICYPHVGVTKGGMYIQIQKTAEALQQCGVEVVFQSPWENQLPDCDICHAFSTNEAVYGMMQAAISAEKPTVWSTVFNVFSRPMWQLKTQIALSEKLPGFYTAWKICRQLSISCSHVIALNDDEKYRLESVFPTMTGKTSIIPNGIDINFSQGDQVSFRTKFGLSLQDKYVLNVGIMCERKNQLSLIRAAKGKTWKLVLVGPYDESSYVKQCLHEAECLNNVIVTGPLPYGSNLLAGAYAGADVFCLPSFSEVQPLTLIEAAVAGCRLVASNQTPIMQCLKNHVFLCSPNDINGLQYNIEKAFKMPVTAREIILQQPTWKNVGDQISQIYSQLLK